MWMTFESMWKKSGIVYVDKIISASNYIMVKQRWSLVATILTYSMEKRQGLGLENIECANV